MARSLNRNISAGGERPEHSAVVVAQPVADKRLGIANDGVQTDGSTRSRLVRHGHRSGDSDGVSGVNGSDEHSSAGGQRIDRSFVGSLDGSAANVDGCTVVHLGQRGVDDHRRADGSLGGR